MSTAADRPSAPGGGRVLDDVLAQLAEVQTTTEELHVVEEALAAQQRQVQDLLSRYEAEHRWRSQLSALLPIGLCVTDGHGAVVDANPALAALLQVGLQRLRGKPLSVYLDPADVGVFREALRRLRTGEAAEHRAPVTLRPRHRTDERGELFGFPDSPSRNPSEARVQWVLVPAHVPQDADPEPSGTPSVALASALSQLSSLAVGEADQQRLLTRMAALVRSAVPSASWVSITLGPPAEPQRIGTDSTEAQAFDGHQLAAQEGPCWAAHATGAVVTSPDVTTDERWPHLAKLALDGAVRSALALPVQEAGEHTGVINVYSAHRHAFGPANRQVAELVAAAVTGVLQTVAEREALQSLTGHLEKALTSRAVIDQAKGVLMAHLDVDADEAFARLVTLSSRLNVKVRELARLVVEGEAPTVLAALRD